MYSPVWTPDHPSVIGERRFAYSPKLRRQVASSSKLESDYRLLLEFDPEVIRFCEQPATAVAFVRGRWRTSRVDFWVWRKPLRETFVEIKYTSELRDPNSRAHLQIEVQQAAFREAGKTHEVVTEREIWANPVLINSLRTLLIEFDQRHPDMVDECQRHFPAIVAMVHEAPGITVSDVLDDRPASIADEVYRLALFELIRTHQLDASVETSALGPRSALRPVSG